MGEDKAFISKEMDKLLRGIDAEWEIYDKHGLSYTGVPVVLHSFLPPWEINPDHSLTKACVKTYKNIFDEEPRLIKWNFCTNGVATAGRLNIPTIGFGPGESIKAHTIDEFCEISQIEAATKFYANLHVVPLAD